MPFLEHHLRCGDSLIGGRLELLTRLPSDGRHEGKLWSLFGEGLRRAMTKAVALAGDLTWRQDERPQDLTIKADLFDKQRLPWRLFAPCSMPGAPPGAEPP